MNYTVSERRLVLRDDLNGATLQHLKRIECTQLALALYPHHLPQVRKGGSVNPMLSRDHLDIPLDESFEASPKEERALQKEALVCRDHGRIKKRMKFVETPHCPTAMSKGTCPKPL